ncbi:WD domain, G-beta repeat protein [Ancylostoma caninum]|uniref:WD repeat-containing protein 79 n=1 Tax=Ancylostoma caninum TaxID=29170 RepID=A0A368GMR8_ANCCA|nr:WD domain, G-beta repeat protein [Ancylostoma caninum]
MQETPTQETPVICFNLAAEDSLWIAMDSDEEVVPGSCIVENVTEVEMVVTEVAEQQKDEIKSGEVEEEVESVKKIEATSMDSDSGGIVCDAEVCDTAAEEGQNGAKEAKVEAESTTTSSNASTDPPAVLEATSTELSAIPPISEATPTEPSVTSTVFETPPTEVLTTITQPEAVPDKPPSASVIAEATPTEPSTAVDKPEATPTEQPSTSTEDVEKKSVVEAILAKLNDPEAKLNRRERRALQRELEAAQGIQRDFPTASQNTSSDDASISHTSFDKDHSLIAEKWPGRGRSSYKRPATSSNEGESKAPKVQKVQDAPPTIPVRRESVFKFDNVAMHPHDSVKDAFHCARMSYASTSFPINNFLKLCRFSPSGSHVATTSADNSARIFELNAEQKLSLVLKIPLGDPIYDAAWLFDGSDRQFLATTAKHHPIHLWDDSGARFSSYRGINHLDELSAAYSIAFSNDGEKLYGGYDSCIRIWDTGRPGRQHTSIKTWEKQTGGQKSIVSCIAMNKVFAGVYAVATYDGNVGFYSDRTNSLECMFSTESAGITDIHYSCDGQRLFVAPRKSDEILCYDMRMPGTLMFKMLRPFTTNQRACFDVDSAGRYLFSGTSDGQLVVFDLNDAATEMLPIFSRKVADCSVPCVSVYDSKIPIVALGTGERVFPTPRLSSRSEASSDSSDSEEERSSYRRRRHDSKLTNLLQLWKF